MGKSKNFDPSHKVWLATVKEDGKTFDVVVCVSGDGVISNSRVKAAFKPNLVRLVPLMHYVKVVQGGPTNEVKTINGVRHCKGWLLNVFLDSKEYEMLVVASGGNLLSSERVAMGFFNCTKHMQPFRKQIKIDKTEYVNI